MYTDDAWGRLARMPMLGGLAGIYNLGVELRLDGVELRLDGVDPHTLGMLDARAAAKAGQSAVAIPTVEGVALSLVSPGEVQVIRVGPTGAFRTENPIVATEMFSEEHPREWVDALAEFGQAAFIVAPRSPLAYSSIEESLSTSLVGVIDVAYQVDADGFSITPEAGQSR